MKKELFTSIKTWWMLIVLLLAGGVLTVSSVRAANSTLESDTLDSWSSHGYELVTVKAPGEVEVRAAAPGADCVLDTNGMISHWPLDDPLGASTFVDVAGSINGTCDKNAGKCPTRTSGKVGGAFTFDASEKDVITVPAAIGDPGKVIYDNMANGNFSAGVWVKTTQTCITGEINNKVFFGRYRDLNANGTWWLGCTEPGGLAVFRLRDSTDTVRQIDGTSNITDGQWHYVVGVRDSAADKNYLYVDGKLEGMLDAPLYAGNFSSDMPITMGAYDEPTPYYLNGTLDEVVLYDRVLSGSAISSYFESCRGGDIYIPLVIR